MVPRWRQGQVITRRRFKRSALLDYTTNVAPGSGHRPADRPTIARSGDELAADGATFSVHQWRGSGPPQLHVHDADDEAWHVLEGSIEFRFANRTELAERGTTVFVPAGVAHTFVATDAARYLIVLTPRLRALIDELHETRAQEHEAVYRRYASRLVE